MFRENQILCSILSLGGSILIASGHGVLEYFVGINLRGVIIVTGAAYLIIWAILILLKVETIVRVRPSLIIMDSSKNIISLENL